MSNEYMRQRSHLLNALLDLDLSSPWELRAAQAEKLVREIYQPKVEEVPDSYVSSSREVKPARLEGEALKAELLGLASLAHELSRTTRIARADEKLQDRLQLSWLLISRLANMKW